MLYPLNHGRNIYKMTIKLPGLIDPHVHLRDPGQTEKEDFFTGTSAAVAGGYTTVFDMPNNKQPITTFERLKEKMSIAKEKILCDVGFYFGSLGDNFSEFEKVKKKAIGLKLYLNETTGNFLIDKQTIGTIFAAWNGGVIAVHAEDDAVATVIAAVKKTGKRAHFCHISLASDLKQISQAKNEGLPISCGATPHHLFLTDADAKRLGPFGKMKPFLKSKKDVDYLWSHIDEIDVIESDHAPHTKQEKESENPPYGVPGLETTLPLLLTAVSEGRLAIDDIIRMCHTNPARIFDIAISENTYTEVDLNTKYSIRNTALFTKCAWSPFAGRKVTGKVVKTVIRGKTVFENGKILAKPGSGHIVLPT